MGSFISDTLLYSFESALSPTNPDSYGAWVLPPRYVPLSSHIYARSRIGCPVLACSAMIAGKRRCCCGHLSDIFTRCVGEGCGQITPPGWLREVLVRLCSATLVSGGARLIIGGGKLQSVHREVISQVCRQEDGNSELD